MGILWDSRCYVIIAIWPRDSTVLVLIKRYMSNRLKRKRKIELPYWPSEAFMQESLKMIKEGGGKGTDDQIRDAIKKAYWKKRAQILAKELIP